MDPVLVVDDDEDARFTIVEMLRHHLPALALVEASDAFEALAICRNARLRLLVTDLRMPRADGGYLISTAREIQPGLPVLAITACVDQMGPLARLTVKKLVDEMLLKPFAADELVPAVLRLLVHGHDMEQADSVESASNPNRLARRDLFPRRGSSQLLTRLGKFMRDRQGSNTA